MSNEYRSFGYFRIAITGKQPANIYNITVKIKDICTGSTFISRQSIFRLASVVLVTMLVTAVTP